MRQLTACSALSWEMKGDCTGTSFLFSYPDTVLFLMLCKKGQRKVPIALPWSALCFLWAPKEGVFASGAVWLQGQSQADVGSSLCQQPQQCPANLLCLFSSKSSHSNDASAPAWSGCGDGLICYHLCKAVHVLLRKQRGTFGAWLCWGSSLALCCTTTLSLLTSHPLCASDSGLL